MLYTCCHSLSTVRITSSSQGVPSNREMIGKGLNDETEEHIAMSRGVNLHCQPTRIWTQKVCKIAEKRRCIQRRRSRHFYNSRPGFRHGLIFLHPIRFPSWSMFPIYDRQSEGRCEQAQSISWRARGTISLHSADRLIFSLTLSGGRAIRHCGSHVKLLRLPVVTGPYLPFVS